MLCWGSQKSLILKFGLDILDCGQYEYSFDNTYLYKTGFSTSFSLWSVDNGSLYLHNGSEFWPLPQWVL